MSSRANNTSIQTFLTPLLEDKSEIESARRARRSKYDYVSVHPADVEQYLSEGWEIQREGKSKTRLKRIKRHDILFEDRLWVLCSNMGYHTLNGASFKAEFERDSGTKGKKQIDVYAEDDETVLIVECKSKQSRGRRTLQKDIQETKSLQSYIRKTVHARFPGKAKPKIIWVYATENILWSEADIERAEDANINIVTENEVQYYETFIRHMGPAGRYQILGEFLRGQKVSGLSEVKVPAIRGALGGQTFYSFVATPRNLMKIAFINHQALNHPDGRPAYQRMISSSRIKEIGEFIKTGGYFPTNILINFSDKPRWDLLPNRENTDANVKFGWLTLPSKYRSAWVIDGQHRLYGFSDLDDRFMDQSLFVIAFEKLPVQKEADLFITINHKQKSVPKSLLVSLLADIRMGDSDPSTALTALCSGVVRQLNTAKESPLSRRFAIHGVPPEPGQNLTISEVVKGLRRSQLIGGVTKKTLTPGPLTGATDSETIDRASDVLSSYFEKVRQAHPDRWEAGRESYIATNPGMRAHLSLISEIVRHLSAKKSIDFALIKPDEFAKHINNFAKPVFNFIKNASDQEISELFSRKFGEGGVKEYTFHLMRILSDSYDDFGNEEFQRWVEQSTSTKIDEINQFLMKLSERLTDYVIDTLKEVHGTHRLASDEQAFWELGVESERIRKNAFDKQQKDKKRRKPKEAYLDIVDLAEIVKQSNNWPHFEHVFKNPQSNERKGQKYYLGWVHSFNDLRNIAAHKNQMKTYTEDDLAFIEWLRTDVSPKVPGHE
ncbi:MAG: DGQHR domain-containing protein [Pseudomonadota bacterium]